MESKLVGGPAKEPAFVKQSAECSTFVEGAAGLVACPIKGKRAAIQASPRNVATVNVESEPHDLAAPLDISRRCLVDENALIVPREALGGDLNSVLAYGGLVTALGGPTMRRSSPPTAGYWLQERIHPCRI